MFTTVTVTGTLKDASQNPLSAWLSFCLTDQIMDSSNGQYVAAEPVECQTDANGNFTINLIATDDPTTVPSGQAYRLEIQVPSLSNYPGDVGTYFPVYYFALPHTAAPTVNIAQLINLSPVP